MGEVGVIVETQLVEVETQLVEVETQNFASLRVTSCADKKFA